MFKTLKTLVLAAMMTASASLAFAETASFSISVTIPPMIVFDQRALVPEQSFSQQGELPKAIQQQVLVRNNKKVTVASAVVL